MVSLREAAVATAGRFVCSAAQSASDWAGFIAGATEQITGLTPLANGPQIVADAAAAVACSDFGDGTSGGGGAGASWSGAVIGGQCPGVDYVVSGEYDQTVFPGGFPPFTERKTWSFATLEGPIERIFIEELGSSRTIVGIEAGGNRVNMVSGSGSTTQWSNLGPTTASATGGGANDCGDLPAGASGNDTLNYDDGQGNSLNVPVDISLGGPSLTAAGAIIVPVVIVAPTFRLTPTINLQTGDINLNVGGPALPGFNPCCLPGIPDVPLIPGEEDPPPPRNEVLVLKGIIVVITSITTTAKVDRFGGLEGPELYVPRIGIVNLAIKVASTTAWTQDFFIKNGRQYFPVPQDKVGVDWAVRVIPGVTFEVIPEYVSQYVDDD